LQVPPKDSKDLYLQYAALEEKFGLARTAMEVYDKAVQVVPQNQRLPIYDLYLARASEFFGIAKVLLPSSPPCQLSYLFVWAAGYPPDNAAHVLKWLMPAGICNGCQTAMDRSRIWLKRSLYWFLLGSLPCSGGVRVGSIHLAHRME